MCASSAVVLITVNFFKLGYRPEAIGKPDEVEVGGFRQEVETYQVLVYDQLTLEKG